jgi:hypothetical protein
MKRAKRIHWVPMIDDLSELWEGTAEEYGERLLKIQETCQKRGLPIPSERFVRSVDEFNAKNPVREGVLRTLHAPGDWVNALESDLTEFDRCDRQDKFDLIRQITDDGSTMEEGYLDRVFEQYAAAERQGL